MNRELITYNDPKSPVSEMFKTLRTNIQFMNSDKQLKTLLVSSTLPGEGKSWTAANLAVTFAQAGKKVLIIDGDMRKGRQFNIFGVSPTPGLSNYLSGVSENNIDNSNINNYIQQTEVENLFVMTAGNVPPNPSELLVSEKMIELSKIVRELFDITIFDGTPSLIVTDAPILARIVDSTIIVTAHNETKIDNVSKVKKAIENIGGKVAGVVVNKMPVSAKKYENSYYYGSTMPTVAKGKKNKHNKKYDSTWNETTTSWNDTTSSWNETESKTETSIEKEIKENWNQIEEQTWETTEPTTDDWKNSSEETESWTENSSTETNESWTENSSTETSESWNENNSTEWEENEKIIDTTNLNNPSSKEWESEQWSEDVSESPLDWSNTTQEEEPVAAEPILSWEQDNSKSSSDSIFKSFDNVDTNYDSSEFSESTQNVINQINKYLKDEKNKLKNGDLND